MASIKPTASLSKASLLKNTLNSGVKNLLFLEAARNLNWSRNYLWYCELDGVPQPFHRGGAIGLPVSSFQYTITGDARSYSINNNITDFIVPQNVSHIHDISLTLYDDEKGTLRQFFERWWNEVYNPFYGVLPLDESVKCLSLYYQKTTRRNVQRAFKTQDEFVHPPTPRAATGGLLNQTIKSKLSSMWSNLKHQEQLMDYTTDGTHFLVYPTGSVTVNSLQSNGSETIQLQINLAVAHVANQDFGPSSISSGIQDIFGIKVGESDGTSFLDKITNYI